MRHFFTFMVGVGCLGFLDTAHSQTYDLGLDFMDAVVPSVGIGPDGVWSYGFDFSDVNVTNPVAFTPYTLHGGAPADLAADQVRHHRRGAAIGHMRYVESARQLFELLPAQMQDRAEAGGAVSEFPRILPDQRYEALHVGRGNDQRRVGE